MSEHAAIPGAITAKSLDDYFRDWEGSALGFGYGSGEPHTTAALRRFFELTPPPDADSRSYDYEVLEHELGPVVAWFIISLMGHQRLIEYGTSPRYAWLTAEGYRLREYMLSKSLDELLEALRGDPDYVECYRDHCNCTPERPKCSNPFWITKP